MAVHPIRPSDDQSDVSTDAPSATTPAGESATDSAAEPQPDENEPDGSGRSRTLAIIALVVGLVVFVVLFGMEARENRALTGQVVTLEGELAGTRAELAGARSDLAAHDRHLSAVRRQVGNLSRELVALEALANQDPTAAVPTDGEAP